MTIQESLIAQFRKNDVLAWSSWILGVILMFASISWLGWLKNICFLVFVGCGFYSVLFIQCPQCKFSVFWTTLKHQPISLKRVPDACSNCGCDYLVEKDCDS